MTVRVLMVDDEPDNRQIVHDLLVHAGYEVTLAGDGEQGVASALASAPDLVVMDIQLPGMDGYEATRRIKAELPEVPIIAVTSHALRGDQAKALAAGCDAYIAKPFSPRRLLDTIREHLGQRLPGAPGGADGVDR